MLKREFPKVTRERANVRVKRNMHEPSQDHGYRGSSGYFARRRASFCRGLAAKTGEQISGRNGGRVRRRTATEGKRVTGKNSENEPRELGCPAAKA